MKLAVVALLALAACRPAPPRRVVIANRAAPFGQPERGNYHGAITEASLQTMMAHRFASQLDTGTFVAEYSGTTPDLLAELEAMGIHDLGQLARIIPTDYDRRAAFDFTTDSPANIPGVIRDLFIIHDARRYFRDAWRNHWQSLAEENLPMYRAYGVDLNVLVEFDVVNARALTSSSSP